MRETAKRGRPAEARQQEAERLGVALRALRLSADMTVRELALEAGVSLRYLSQAENGLVNVTDGWVRIVTETIGRHLAAQRDLAATG
ncbi:MULTISPECIES: helix-turn-helix domain-containing protein [unclassified Aeromicrobium]|uniref:helix-turn-helix domain-containing protein n=1 Tax=unclassified Aeromicrobium TaxID=2633570 RepID=UPI00288C634B|nr:MULTISPECIES: helix-turn-helix domain-containing protein [unclassified Aeromicrobium]